MSDEIKKKGTPIEDEDFGLPELEYFSLDDEEKPQVDKVVTSKPVNDRNSADDEVENNNDESSSSDADKFFDIDEVLRSDSEEDTKPMYADFGSEEENERIKDRVIIDKEEGGNNYAWAFLGLLFLVALGFGVWYFYTHYLPQDSSNVTIASETENTQNNTTTGTQREGGSENGLATSGGAGSSNNYNSSESTTTGSAQSDLPGVNLSGMQGVNCLCGRTNSYYMIVGSFSNLDLARKHANKLTKGGNNTFMIPPFNGSPRYRVAISGFTSLEDASSKLPSYRRKYGKDTWVLKF